MSKKTRLFFVTDIHGSERCFRKFLNAAKFFNANILVLGGDITGKLIVPIIDQGNGTYKSNYAGDDVLLKNKEEAETLVKTIKDSGNYPYFTDQKQFEEMSASTAIVNNIFTGLIVERIKGWMKLAEERLMGTGIKCYISPGNEDIFEIDDALNSSSYVTNLEEKVVTVDGEHEMITLGYTNHTPWHSPREVDEDILSNKIESMAKKVKDPKRAIWNIHMPPINTQIDQALKLDAKLKPVICGQMVMSSFGSTATRQSIEKYQPLMGIHGHFHESKGAVKIGRTLCFNPGSEYAEGILAGLLCDLEGDKIESYMLNSG